MDSIEKLDKRGMYGVKRETEGVEYRIEGGLRRKEERKRLREGIGNELIRKR